MAHLFQDSKTFVDMKLKFEPEQTLSDFETFMSSKNNQPTEDEVREFVNVSINFRIFYVFFFVLFYFI